MLKTVRVPDKFAPLFEQAQAYVNRYFADQKATPEHGTLEITGERYMLVRAASLSVEFYEMVRGIYSDPKEARAVANDLLFDIAHAMGIGDARSFGERMQLSDPIARLSAGPIHFAHAGWAFVDIFPESEPSPDERYFLLYDHPYSFESASWLSAGKVSDCPVCIMSAGYSSGWCENSFGMPLVAVEILCQAKGDATCRFIMAPPGRIEGHVARYLREHPELASSVTGYQIPGFLASRTDRQLLRKNLELEQRAVQRALELGAINEQLERDIAERRRTEAALSASMELNERLIEALPGGVVQVGKDGELLRINAEAARILGLSYDALSQRYVGDFDQLTVFEDGTPASVADYPVTRAMLTGQTQPATTLGVRKPNGETAWAVFRAVPMRDLETQEVNGAVVTFFDITERKRFEEKLLQAQKLESLGVLAGGIAHDFNNLLVTMLANASFARALSPGDERVATVLAEIETSARRAAELTRQMLDYSGQGKLRVENLDAPKAIREMSKLLSATIPKHVELFFHFQDGLPLVPCDPTQVRQVLMNLITNAAESIADGVGRVEISVRQQDLSEAMLEQCVAHAARPGTFVCIEVRDTGSGMDAETRSKIFDPFFTTKFQGRGLGMAAVLGIVRGHHGALQVESQLGQGTRISVLLPLLKLEPRVEPSESSLARGTILIVDDDRGVQTVASRCLSNKGYRTLTASDGVEALRVFEAHRSEICLVLMDMTMPRMSGLDALSKLRESSDVPVLLSSGYELDPARIRGAKHNGILEKPYDAEQLCAAVEKLIH